MLAKNEFKMVAADLRAATERWNRSATNTFEYGRSEIGRYH
jgi:hypothetical protein